MTKGGHSLYDKWLVWILLLLLGLGFIIVTSASMAVGERLAQDPLLFAKRTLQFLLISLVLACITLQIPLLHWYRHNGTLLLLSILLLVLTLLIGKNVNGATRWIQLPGLRFQPSEFAKLAFFCYLSRYLADKSKELQTGIWGFSKPLSVMLLLAVFILTQPDLGTLIIIFCTTLVLLFVANGRISQFVGILAAGGTAIVFLVVLEPYRLKRVMAFRNPWADPFGSGYQLTQSLMSFGRGGTFGSGLGNGIQKLEYLPEPHTDFIFAVLAEELGYIAVSIVIALLSGIVFRGLAIGTAAFRAKNLFGGFFSQGIAVWFGLHIVINIGGITGLLPMKGLTLPLLSYGGSSLLMMTTAVAILLRIDFETRLAYSQAHKRGQDDQ